MPVLIIDDDALGAESLAAIFKARGFDSMWATNADAAVEKLGGVVPRLLVIDAAMPGRDGPGLLRSLRQQDGWGHVPCVFLTALAGDALRLVRAAAESMPPAAVVRKPAEADEVLAAADALK